jgi:hypothetical protein
MGVEVKIIADSISHPAGKRITTFQLKYQRFFHSELMTHRMLSRNASSSRAIPVAKMLAQVWNDPAMPVYWGSNKAGMQAGTELTGIKKKIAQTLWVGAGRAMCVASWVMMKLGMHKQITNRMLEPWQYISVVVTATEWDNFYALRNHKDAQPEFRELAAAMMGEYWNSTPVALQEGEWHLPYVSEKEIQEAKWLGMYQTLPKLSAARCARVSYNKHDGTKPSIAEDMELYNQLMTRPYTDKRGNVYDDSAPIHASPVEHQAFASLDPTLPSGNFRGWVQLRKLIERNRFE